MDCVLPEASSAAPRTHWSSAPSRHLRILRVAAQSANFVAKSASQSPHHRTLSDACAPCALATRRPPPYCFRVLLPCIEGLPALRLPCSRHCRPPLTSLLQRNCSVQHRLSSLYHLCPAVAHDWHHVSAQSVHRPVRAQTRNCGGRYSRTSATPRHGRRCFIAQERAFLRCADGYEPHVPTTARHFPAVQSEA